MKGRPGEISKVVARLGELQMTLAVRNGQPSPDLPRCAAWCCPANHADRRRSATLADALVSYAKQSARPPRPSAGESRQLSLAWAGLGGWGGAGWG